MPKKDKSASDVPKANIIERKKIRLSLIWIIPIIAAVAGIWIVVTNILERGPEITIVFQSADGLEAQKTKINYNGLDVGVISSIKLADDHKTIIATAQMDPDVGSLMVEDTKFWVVCPRIKGMSVSGLGTLLSGNYIGMQVGKSKKKALKFVALDTPPLIDNTPGRIFKIRMSELGSIGIGTSVFFRQLKVGQIVSYELDETGKFFRGEVFIQAPYDKFVNTDTRFWQASGIDLSMSANGIRVKTESLMAILDGGVAFENPSSGQKSFPVESGTVFELFSSREEAFKPPIYAPHSYMLVFKQSVRGLTVGAPVLFYGITIGEVTKITPQVDMEKMEVCVQVIISIDPRRYGVQFINMSESENKADANKKMITALNDRGFRAQLDTGNLITGALLVSFEFIPDAPLVTLDWSLKPLQLPTVSSTFNSIENNAGSLVKNLNKASLRALKTISDINKLIDVAKELMNNANQIIEPSSLMNSELNKLLIQSNGAVRAFGILADYLERHPESLIYGKEGEPKKMKKNLFYLVTIISSLIFVSGCISSSSKYYILNSTVKSDGSRNTDYTVAIDQVSVPLEVDRPQIVIKVGSNQVAICEFNRWAESLDSNIAGVVAHNLAALLGTNKVVVGPVANFKPTYRVTIDVQSFDSDLGESAKIIAVWTVNKSIGGTSLTGATVALESLEDDSFNSLAAAHSKALAKLSSDIAIAIQTENEKSKKQ